MAGEVRAAGAARASSTLLALRDVSKGYPGVQALDRLSLSIAPGEVHALLGANGAGKSTLIKILAGAVERDEGEIEFAGQRIGSLSPQESAALGVVCLFQEPALAPALSVEQNIFLGREMTSRLRLIQKDRQRERALGLLREVAPHIDPGRPVGALRTSERQLVALAKGLLREPKLLILDEPSASMTDPEIDGLFAIIGRLRDSGVSVLYVTHRLDEVFRLSDRLTVLRDGKLARTAATADVTRPELVSLIAGREVRAGERRGAIERGAVLLSVRGLGRAGVFSDISFDVHAGEVVALAGLVGAGRTEIARAVFGADAYDEGTVRRPLSDRDGQGPHSAVRAGLAMVPEDRKAQGIVPKMSMADNLALSSAERFANRLTGFIDFKAVGAMVARNVVHLDIRPRGAEARPVETLSGGNQQKVLLGRAMESGASVLILDEPTAGVDIGAKSEIQRLIIELANAGKGILIISSEMEEVLALADRILVIREGRLARELVGHGASSFDILRSALGEEEQTHDAGRTH